MFLKKRLYKKAKTTPKHRPSKPAGQNRKTSSQQTDPAALIQRAGMNPESLSRNDVLQLQDTIGNQAVLRLLTGKNQRREPLKNENRTGLPEGLKSGIERLSGYSMDDVKVYYNSNKPAQLQAFAYAEGTDIHLGSGQEKQLPHEAWHVVQQKQGRVKPTMRLKSGLNLNGEIRLEKEADVMGQRAVQRGSHQTMQDSASTGKLFRAAKSPYSASKVIQGDFFELDDTGAMVRHTSNPSRNMRPWIDQTSGNQAVDQGLNVYFDFKKAGLERQKHKGSRVGDETTGLELGDQFEHRNTVGGTWPGSRNWPRRMQGPYSAPGGVLRGSATNQRNQLANAVHAQSSSWGHQVAMQWGGPANLDNAVSATNDTVKGLGQEEYQTIVEDAVNYMVNHNSALQLSDFRIKHTVYKYPRTNVAKYVRFKIYRYDNVNSQWLKVVDQVTPDFAQFLGGGRSNPQSARGNFQISIETQLSALNPVPNYGSKKGTNAAVVKSWASVVDRAPFATIRHPFDNETIHSEHYSINIEADVRTNNVEVLIQRVGTNGTWNQTRQTSDGTWWYDWSNIENGQYEIQSRAWKADGQMVEGKRITITKN